MPENCNVNDCPLLPRVELLEDANKQHTQTHREIFGRLKDLEASDAVQKEQYTTILAKLTALTSSFDALHQKLSELESKPAKRWENMVDKVLWAVAAAVIAFILGRIGL